MEGMSEAITFWEKVKAFVIATVSKVFAEEEVVAVGPGSVTVRAYGTERSQEVRHLTGSVFRTGDRAIVIRLPSFTIAMGAPSVRGVASVIPMPFGGYGGNFGVSDEVARVDHVHDLISIPGAQGNHWNSNTNRTIDSSGTTVLASGTLPLADGVTYKCFCIGYFEGYSALTGPSGTTLTINLGSASSTSETLISEGGVNAPKLRFATTTIVGTGSTVTFSVAVNWVSGDTRIESAQCAALAIPM